MRRAPVNRIIPFSNVDGPGNRTSVFFQGCPFDCMFCHNPETIHMCTNCGACVPGCPAGALTMDESGNVVWDKEKCVQCDACIRACPHTASPRVRFMTTDEILHEIKRTLPYITGITTSGGECTLQNDFLIELFEKVRSLKKEPQLTCLLDSNGSFDFENDPRILAVCEGVMLDVKAVGKAWSDRLISFPNEIVLKNLDYLLHAGKLQEVRTVLFPKMDEQNEETVRYVAAHIGNACDYKLIRYRPFGVREKYRKLLGEDETPAEYAEMFADLARRSGAGKAFVV